MADFNITVDTSPMAESIETVNKHVKGVTTSVVAMEAAVVLAQNEASKKICSNVDNGFYLLMRSQLSQKLAAVESEIYSKKQLMETFKQQIEKIMAIMSDDYERIKRRYSRHFASLNAALETRVHELDKRAYDISKNYKMSQFKAGNDVLKTFAYSNDSEVVNVQAVGATVKNKSAKTMNVLADDVVESVKYSRTLFHILKNNKVNAEEEKFIPVIVVESDSMFAKETTVNNIYFPQANSNSDGSVINHVQEEMKEFGWVEIDNESYDFVKNVFLSKCNSDGLDSRVAKEMLRLFSESKWSMATLNSTSTILTKNEPEVSESASVTANQDSGDEEA